MNIPTQHSDKYFFHFTHLENLDSILKHGLLSTNQKKILGIQHLDVASSSIQERRGSMQVTCEPGGTVHDYVPFYFCSMNPMLLSLVNSKNIDQQMIIFFAISIKKIVGSNIVFTNASANTTIPPNFYNSPEYIDDLDWDEIESKKWSPDTDDAKHKRMAEVLILDRVPIDFIDDIIVWNNAIKEKVQEIFKDNELDAPNISFEKFKSKYYFYFTKFMLGQESDSLLTGPFCLKSAYENAIKTITQKRSEVKQI